MVQLTYDPNTETVGANPLTGGVWENTHNAQVILSEIVSGATPVGDRFWRLTAATATSAQGAMQYGPDSYDDAEILVCVRRSTVRPIIGGAARIAGALGSSKSLYAGCVRNNTTDGRVWKWVNGTGTSVNVAPHGIAQTVGEWLWVLTQVVGSTIRVKVWADGTSEPASWLLEETDTDLTNGEVGRLVFFTNADTADDDLAWWSAGTGADSAPRPGAAGNVAPEVDASADDSATEGVSYNHAVSATDADGDPITLTTSVLPGGLVFTDNGDGTGTISGTPDAGTAASSPYSITVTADDGTDTSVDSYTLTVTEDAPAGELPVVESFSSSGADATVIDCPAPAGIQAGDLLIGFHRGRSDSGTAFSSPSGFTEISSLSFRYADDPGNHDCAVAYKWADAGDESASTYAWEETGSIHRHAVIMLRVSGVHEADPFGLDDYSDTDFVAPSVALDSNDLPALALRLFGRQGDSSFTLPGTEVAQEAGDSGDDNVARIGISTQGFDDPDTETGAATATTTTSSSHFAATLVLRPAAATTDPNYSLSVSTVGSGSVELDPAGGIYTENDVVSVEAIPDSGWIFDSWSGDLTGAVNPQNLTMDGNKSVTATFIESLPVAAPTNVIVTVTSRTSATVTWTDVAEADQFQVEVRVRGGVQE